MNILCRKKIKQLTKNIFLHSIFVECSFFVFCLNILSILFQAITLMLGFGMFILSLLTYLEKKK
ncbi:putative holin-like toxin [Bacillus atrophaeus]|uniref:putative holin-like toxin n=1 Tax=Bacillus atrophaeus TaxID=1452 RepID=UPI00399093E8